MGLIFVLVLVYVGGPLGLLFLLIGGIRMARNTNPDKHGWPGLLVVFGAILVIAAGLMLFELSNTNFGL